MRLDLFSRCYVVDVQLFKNLNPGSARTLKDFPGLVSEGVPPVPIPNTEVKPFSADGTARATVWESRSTPGF